jgi:hypothetical protein
MLGTLLLVAYMGGAIATHVQHGLPIFAPVMFAVYVRFPQLTNSILNKGC